MFDAFLRHEEARVARDDLAPITLKSHRQILDCVWRPALGRLPFLAVPYSMMVTVADSHRWNKKTYNNAISALRRAFAFGYLDHPDRIDPATRLRSAKMGKKDRPRIDPFSIQDAEVFIAALHQDWGEAHGNYEEFRFFTGLGPSEEIALTVSDYDRVHRVLRVTKARVDGIDKDCTKTGEDRRIQFCPRAVAILERQLQVRTRLMEQHGIQHEPHLFVTDEGRPIPDVAYPYGRWERTLKRLRIRYRRPYVARHTSVSWNLMMSRNPLLVAKEHGHRILTMLTVYAAWTEDAVEEDFWAIHDAVYRTDLDTLRRRSVTPRCAGPHRLGATMDERSRMAQSTASKMSLRTLRVGIRRFGPGCRIAALKPYALQFERPPDDADLEWRARMNLDLLSRETRSATAKLKDFVCVIRSGGSRERPTRQPCAAFDIAWTRG